MEALKELERILDVPAKAKEHILAELRSHCEEARDELTESGATPGQAEMVAADRLGSPEELAGDFLAVYGPGRKTFLLILAPFLVALINGFHRNISQLVGRFPVDLRNWIRFAEAVDALLVLVCLVILGGTAWAVVRPRKPAWLSSWLVGSFLPFFLLTQRLNLRLYGWVFLILHPATLNLWLYRARPRHRPYVLAIWVILLLDMLFVPRSFRGPVPAAVVAIGYFEFLLRSGAWILFAAALAPRGRGNWAIYSSLSIFVYLISGGWFRWRFLGGSGEAASFWISVTVAPIVIWVLLYSKKIWMKIGVLASGVALFQLATAWTYLRVMDATSAIWTVLRLFLELAIVITPLLLWHRRRNEAGDLRLAAK